MTGEELEFQISQYLDGQLPSADAAALEERFATDASARALLEEYRGLATLVKRELPLPVMNWDRLASHISSVVADEALPEVQTFKIAWYRRPSVFAIAASVLIALGVAIGIYHSSGRKP